mgnify:CR=1 FL=1
MSVERSRELQTRFRTQRRSSAFPAYTLDAWGNHTQQQNGGTNIGFGYDALGNMRQYTYNLAGTNIQYIVDGRNRRVAKYDGNFLGGYLYEGDRVIATVNSANNVDAYFVYVTKPNVPDIMARWDNINWKWVAYRIISDQIGSARLIVDSSGTVIEGPFFYETRGTTATWPTVVPFGWAGGLWDGSGGNGLYHFRARDYNPWVARWWSKDPIGFKADSSSFVPRHFVSFVLRYRTSAQTTRPPRFLGNPPVRALLFDPGRINVPVHRASALLLLTSVLPSAAASAVAGTTPRQAQNGAAASYR